MSDGSVSTPGSGPPGIDGLRSDWFQLGEHRLHYWIGGPEDGRAVLLWHGFLGTGWSWRLIAPALVRQGHRVLVIDMLGDGDSDKPAGTDVYAARALVGQVRQLATHVGLIGPILLVGHDMGAPPALLWAADHPDEVAGLVYVEAPTMIGAELRTVISYDAQAMAQGSMWWWILPLAPGVPEALVVGREREFLQWFYQGPAGAPAAFDDGVVTEMLRPFTGRSGVLGAMGVYRAAFATIGQTEQLVGRSVRPPVVSVAGEHGLGHQVAAMLGPLVPDLTSHIIAGCGHFVAEQAPRQLLEILTDLAEEVFPQTGTSREHTPLPSKGPSS